MQNKTVPTLAKESLFDAYFVSDNVNGFDDYERWATLMFEWSKQNSHS